MHLYRFPSDGPTRPAPELLLAQLILSTILLIVLGCATYEKEHTVETYVYQIEEDPRFFRNGHKSLSIDQFRMSYTVLFLTLATSAYLATNLLFYLTIRMARNPMDLYKTRVVVCADLMFCVLMAICSIAAMSHPGHRAVHRRETQILIASGISMFCCVSSGVGFYYSYRIYKGK